jgi:nucleoid DNA-binding protein
MCAKRLRTLLVPAKKRIIKKPIVKALAKAAGIPYTQADFIYDVFFDVIVTKVKEGYSVLLPGIGSINIIKTKSTISNMTGQTIPRHNRLKLHANEKLARYIRVTTREHPIGKIK